jgi:hypothetical protein
VLVYHTLSVDAGNHATFAAPAAYSVGTDPVGLTIQDINGDGVPDMLVANQGSNDVSVLFGAITNGVWTATAGPRLQAGAGPVATTLHDMNGDGTPDLVVTNGQAGTFSVLPGRGQGFFDDRAAAVQVINIPGNPTIETTAINNSTGSGVVVTGNGTIIGVNLDKPASIAPVFTPSPGVGVAAVSALPDPSDGRLVVALQDGTVALLAQDAASGQFAVADTFHSLTGAFENPSELAVLQTSAGLQVLATKQGDDQVFVFSLDTDNPSTGGDGETPGGGSDTFVGTLPPAPELDLVPTNLPLTPKAPVPTLIPPSDTPLALVLTLGPSDLPLVSPSPADALPAQFQRDENPSALPVQFQRDENPSGNPGTRNQAANGAGDEENENDQDNKPLPSGSIGSGEERLRIGDYGLGVEETLRNLDLYPNEKTPAPGTPMSRVPPTDPSPHDTVVAALQWVFTEQGTYLTEIAEGTTATPLAEEPLWAETVPLLPSPLPSPTMTTPGQAWTVAEKALPAPDCTAKAPPAEEACAKMPPNETPADNAGPPASAASTRLTWWQAALTAVLAGSLAWLLPARRGKDHRRERPLRLPGPEDKTSQPVVKP